MKHVIQTWKKYVVFLLAVTMIFLCIIRYSQVKSGVLHGMEVCAGSVLPALFPMLILCSFLTHTGIPHKLKRILFYPIGVLSGRSELCAEIFLFGSMGGYPIGIKTAAALYCKDDMRVKELQAAALANVNPGLAFSILVAGKQCFGSVNAGITLYASVCMGNILLCQILRSRKTNADRYIEADIKNELPAQALVLAVESAVKNAVSVSAWITAFYAFTALCGNALNNAPFVFFAEVTGAVFYCASDTGLPTCAFCLAFGGFCVLLQLLPELRTLKISVPKYLFCRVFSAACAYAAEKAFIHFLPESVLTASYVRTVFAPAVGSFWLTGALALLSTVFIVSNTTAQTAQKRYLRSRLLYDNI